MNQPQHRMAPYIVKPVQGGYVVEDTRTGNQSRPVLSETEARIQLHALRLRNLINE